MTIFIVSNLYFVNILGHMFVLFAESLQQTSLFWKGSVSLNNECDPNGDVGSECDKTSNQSNGNANDTSSCSQSLTLALVVVSLSLSIVFGCILLKLSTKYIKLYEFQKYTGICIQLIPRFINFKLLFHPAGISSAIL